MYDLPGKFVLAVNKSGGYACIKSVVLSRCTNTFAPKLSSMEIYKEFGFDAAHFLPHVPDGHRCKNMHGHTYHLRVYIKGTPGKDTGWLYDFKDLKDLVRPLVDQLDHTVINNVAGLENPTAENITIWFWDHLKPILPELSRIELKETPTTGVVYSGE